MAVIDLQEPLTPTRDVIAISTVDLKMSLHFPEREDERSKVPVRHLLSKDSGNRCIFDPTNIVF